MTARVGLLGVSLGGCGLAAGLAGLVLDGSALALVAGGLGLGAGTVALSLGRQLEASLTAQRLLEIQGASVPKPPPAGTVADLEGTEPTATPESTAPSPDNEPAAGTGQWADGMGRSATPEGFGTALVDAQTGLFSEDFFQVALDSRIAAARRHLRPVAMALVEVVSGLPSGEPVPVDANLVATTIKDTLREADTACRLQSGYFALLLEDTPENGAIWTIERIRRQLTEDEHGLTVWAGVACYPAHAFSPDRLLSAAEQALVAARDWRQDRIEVAATAE